MIHGWRVEFGGWEGLTHAQKRRFLGVVGEFGGEWWGKGRAKFDDRVCAIDCVRVVAREVGIKPDLVLWNP